jgi:hypothetical protein
VHGKIEEVTEMQYSSIGQLSAAIAKNSRIAAGSKWQQ